MGLEGAEKNKQKGEKDQKVAKVVVFDKGDREEYSRQKSPFQGFGFIQFNQRKDIKS